jgi:DNA-binding protein H-NS
MVKAARVPARKTAAVKKKTPTKTDAMVADLTVAQLDALIKAATARRDTLLAGARTSFIDEVKSKAASLGMSLADLIGQGPKKAAPKTAAAKTAPTRQPPEAKYRNPTSGETWSGRGRTARWMAELEAKGHKREEFSV